MLHTVRVHSLPREWRPRKSCMFDAEKVEKDQPTAWRDAKGIMQFWARNGGHDGAATNTGKPLLAMAHVGVPSTGVIRA